MPGQMGLWRVSVMIPRERISIAQTLEYRGVSRFAVSISILESFCRTAEFSLR